jgi:hypothetical protein
MKFFIFLFSPGNPIEYYLLDIKESTASFSFPPITMFKLKCERFNRDSGNTHGITGC